MTQATDRNYWISPTALTLSLNALDNPNYMQVSLTSGAAILCYIKGIEGLGYDDGHNYHRWLLTADSVAFGTDEKKYVYVRIPRTPKSMQQDPLCAGITPIQDQLHAQLCYPSEQIDLYGCTHTHDGYADDEVTQLGTRAYYYIFLGGIISATTSTTTREWVSYIQTGILATDEDMATRESEWYTFNAVDDIVYFLKQIAMKAESFFRNLNARIINIVAGGSINFSNGDTLNGVAGQDTSFQSVDTIATPKYVDDNALSKHHDDKTNYDIEMKNLRANGRADIFGNTVIKGNLTVGTADIPADIILNGDVTIGTYNKGIEGAHIDFYGNAEFESIAARSFLDVPELRYNRTTITVGNKWQTIGAGIIESVTPYDAYTGKATLKLAEGEVGAIAVNDLCQGVFHIGTNDDKETTDTHDGNFHFAGFTTIYFKVTRILNANNSEFEYELRAKTCHDLPLTDRNHWTDATHPQPMMHFAAYANPTNADRQQSRLTTTTYTIHLAGMTDWTYTQDNMRLIQGWLTGFTLLQRIWDKERKEYIVTEKKLSGEGIATGNIYMWGNIDQFDRAPLLTGQQLFYKATGGDSSPATVPGASASGLTPPEGILISSHYTEFNLNGWQKDPIQPSPENRYVWQQWLYIYSDGTYNVSDVALHSTDTTTCIAYVDKPVVSLGISDWYDPQNPDDVDFTIIAHLDVGNETTPLSNVVAAYDGALCESMDYEVTYNDTRTHATIHVTLRGFVGTQVSGVTPDDAFLTITLQAGTLGSAKTTVTLAQNRQGDDGVDGEPGDPGKRGTTFRILDWDKDVRVPFTFYDEKEYSPTVTIADVVFTPAGKYLCKKSFVLTDIALTPNKDPEHWEPFNEFRNIATDLILAEKGYIKNLITNDFYCEEYGMPEDPEDPIPFTKLWMGLEEIAEYPRIRLQSGYKNADGTTSVWEENYFGRNGTYFHSTTGLHNDITCTHVYITQNTGLLENNGVWIQGPTYEAGKPLSEHHPHITITGYVGTEYSGVVAQRTTKLSHFGLSTEGNVRAGKIKGIEFITREADLGALKGLTGYVKCDRTYLIIVNGLVVGSSSDRPSGFDELYNQKWQPVSDDDYYDDEDIL